MGKDVMTENLTQGGTQGVAEDEPTWPESASAPSPRATVVLAKKKKLRSPASKRDLTKQGGTDQCECHSRHLHSLSRQWQTVYLSVTIEYGLHQDQTGK
jgi:hypothetical protein